MALWRGSQAVTPIRPVLGLLAVWHSSSVCWRSWEMSCSIALLWRSSSLVRRAMSNKPDCPRTSNVLRKRRWRTLVVPFLWSPLDARREEEPVVCTVDAGGEPWLEQAIAGVEEDTVSLGEEEHENANLGCLLRCWSSRLLVPGVLSLLSSVHTFSLRFWSSSFDKDISGGFLLGCVAIRE